MEGRIIKQISNDYTVLSDQLYVCKSRGKFRNLKITPLVGDLVTFDEKNHYILDVKERKNYLIRPSIANVDYAFIITSLKDPDFDSYLLDKLLVTIEFHNIVPILIFTKWDLLKDPEEMEKILSFYKKMGYQCFKNTQIEEIRFLFSNKITVFTGQSGAGKSTLLNHLDPALQLKTDDISYALGRGKHTTRHTELLPIGGGYVADTPGFSSIHLEEMTILDIRDQFKDFVIYQGECKYHDCMHDKEDGCKIKEMVKQGYILKSRYENYLTFLKEKRNEKVKYKRS